MVMLSKLSLAKMSLVTDSSLDEEKTCVPLRARGTLRVSELSTPGRGEKSVG